VKCPHCEREYTESEDQRTCPRCGASLEPDNQPPEIDFDKADAPPQEDQLAAQSRHEYCPWEDQENLGFMESMIQTVKQSVFSPHLFFSSLPRRGGFLQPLLYGVSLQMLGSFVGFLWSMAFGNAVSQLIAMMGGSAVVLGLLIPVFVFLGIAVWAVTLHVSLYLVGGANEDFEATFRVVCYTSGAEIFNVIPFLGGVIKGIWQLYITVVGLREVQGISTGRAVGAIAIPFVFCCALPLAGLLLVLIASH
jgi:hypothetical protein